MLSKTLLLCSVLHQLDQKIIYSHHDFKHLTEKYFEIGMKLNDFSIQLVKYCIAASNVFSCTETARCYPFVANAPYHDAFTRCLQRQPPDTEALWDEVKNHVKPEEGFLIVDNSTLDKPYAKEMAFVRRMWSGKHHRTVKGIGLITLVWTDGTTVIPVDFRIYNIDEDDKTKNDHFRDMIDKGEERGFNPEFVLFDTWYASVKN